jgi:glutamyl/glutaminyl-tRNA synthetase
LVQAIELINKELAYVCFLNTEQTREYRGTLKQAALNIIFNRFNKFHIFFSGVCIIKA